MISSSSPDAVVFGANGGIGSAMLSQLSQREDLQTIYAVSRRPIAALSPKIRPLTYTPTEDGLQAVADMLPLARLGLVFVATGTLHDETRRPEKTIRQFTEENFLDAMRINAALPLLIAKALLPALKKNALRFAVLSARVGSISDNRLGGWHSYRASKAALNMLMRNLAIEVSRSNPNAIIASLHPGTVDTALSSPFQSNVPAGKLFSPEQSAASMLKVLEQLTPAHSGRCFDYAGKEIEP